MKVSLALGAPIFVVTLLVGPLLGALGLWAASEFRGPDTAVLAGTAVLLLLCAVASAQLLWTAWRYDRLRARWTDTARSDVLRTMIAATFFASVPLALAGTGMVLEHPPLSDPAAWLDYLPVLWIAVPIAPAAAAAYCAFRFLRWHTVAA